MQVTLIAAAYNCAAMLPRFFDALAAQTCQDFELVFVDDASTDATFEMAQELGQVLGNRMHLLRNHANLGLSATRNEGLSHAEALACDYISFLDVDDTFDAFYLQDMVSVANKTGADLVVAGIKRIDARSGRLLATEMVHASRAFYPDASACAELAFINPCSYAKLFCFDKVRSICFRDIARSEDTCYLFDALPHLNGVAFTNQAHYCYYLNEGSLTSAFGKAAHDSMHRTFAQMLGEFAEGEKAAFEDQFQAQVFIRSSVGAVLRRARAGERASVLARAELAWLDEAMPAWRTNPYVSMRGGEGVSGKRLGLALCAALYKAHAAALFVVGYNLLARLSGKEVRI